MVSLFTKDQLELSKKMNVPGPGSYSFRDKPGQYIQSQMPNLGAPVMRKAKRGRFSSSMSNLPTYTPGPGNYDVRDGVSRGGYIQSNFKNLGNTKFGARIPDNSQRYKQFIPGPGAYEAPSDFGSLNLMSLKVTRRQKRL